MAVNTKDIIEIVNDSANVDRINEDKDRFLVYQGQLKRIVRRAMEREFKKEETIRELSHRLVPINIVQKIVDKLSTVYLNKPIRSSIDKNPQDDELIELYESAFKSDLRGRSANRYFKLHKHTATEFYIDKMGIPRKRVMPSQTYTPISMNSTDPESADIFVKHIKFSSERDKQIHHVWTDEEFKIIDGKGNIINSLMMRMDNPKGVNPFGVIPQSHIKEADDGLILPISDDDLISIQIVISALLTDLTFASKYQLWSIYVLKGIKKRLEVFLNPNAILQLPEGVDLDTIKPDVDVDKSLMLIETLIGMLLTTKNLSVGDITGSLSVQNASSGIAKMIDRSETTEDRQDQESIFEDAEKEEWRKFSKNILPVWTKGRQLNNEYSNSFSDNFDLSIKFTTSKPTISDSEKVKTEKEKVEAGFTTRRRSIKELNPHMEDGEVDDLIGEIKKEKEQNAIDAKQSIQKAGMSEEEDGEDGSES